MQQHASVPPLASGTARRRHHRFDDLRRGAVLASLIAATTTLIACVWLSRLPPFLQPGDLNIFTQVALAVLVGLACKNAILIVEFAKDLEERGEALMDGMLHACRMRLRPILMTSIAFCAGVLPLIFGGGAGNEMRHAMGIAVFSGMLGVTFFGIFLTPVIYVLLQRRAKRVAAKLELVGGTGDA